MITTRTFINQAVLLALAATAAFAHAGQKDSSTLAVVMTNDPTTNQIQVFDASTDTLLQTLSTNGAGGVAGNARGVKQRDNELVAVVNYGSNSVSLFKRNGNGLSLRQTVTTSSAPVSIDFGNDHMYVAGTTTVDSFAIKGDHLQLDGSATLQLFGD